MTANHILIGWNFNVTHSSWSLRENRVTHWFRIIFYVSWAWHAVVQLTLYCSATIFWAVGEYFSLSCIMKASRRADERVEVWASIFSLRWENIIEGRWITCFANEMKTWKGNWNTNTFLFSLKGLEILHQGRRGQVNNILMEQFKSILFRYSGAANKQYINQSIKPIGKRPLRKPRRKGEVSIRTDLKEIGVSMYWLCSE